MDSRKRQLSGIVRAVFLYRDTRENIMLYKRDYLLGLTDEEKKEFKKVTGRDFNIKMVDYLKKALIYGHTSRISS